MGWSSQYKYVKKYFVVRIYYKGNIFHEIKQFQKAFGTKKEARVYAEAICSNMPYGYHIENYDFTEMDLSDSEV